MRPQQAAHDAEMTGRRLPGERQEVSVLPRAGRRQQLPDRLRPSHLDYGRGSQDAQQIRDGLCAPSCAGGTGEQQGARRQVRQVPVGVHGPVFNRADDRWWQEALAGFSGGKRLAVCGVRIEDRPQQLPQDQAGALPIDLLGSDDAIQIEDDQIEWPAHSAASTSSSHRSTRLVPAMERPPISTTWARPSNATDGGKRSPSARFIVSKGQHASAACR